MLVLVEQTTLLEIAFCALHVFLSDISPELADCFIVADVHVFGQ